MDIYIRKFSLEKANKLKVEFFVEFMNFSQQTEPKRNEKRNTKRYSSKPICTFWRKRNAIWCFKILEVIPLAPIEGTKYSLGLACVAEASDP